MEQAKQRVVNEKKKQNEKKRKAEVTYPPGLQGTHRYTTRGGMCADWAIHDSENDKGQRNFHIHVLLTMRPH